MEKRLQDYSEQDLRVILVIEGGNNKTLLYHARIIEVCSPFFTLEDRHGDTYTFRIKDIKELKIDSHRMKNDEYKIR